MRLPLRCPAAGQTARDVALAVGGDALQAADRDRLFLHAAAPAGGLARAVAGAAENAGKDVRLPVDHDRRRHSRLRRSGGYIPGLACAPGRPTGSQPLCESSRVAQVGRLHDAGSPCRPQADSTRLVLLARIQRRSPPSQGERWLNSIKPRKVFIVGERSPPTRCGGALFGGGSPAFGAAIRGRGLRAQTIPGHVSASR